MCLRVWNSNLKINLESMENPKISFLSPAFFLFFLSSSKKKLLKSRWEAHWEHWKSRVVGECFSSYDWAARLWCSLAGIEDRLDGYTSSAKRSLMAGYRVEKKDESRVEGRRINCIGALLLDERVDEFRSKMLLVIVGVWSPCTKWAETIESIRLMLAHIHIHIHIQRSRPPFRSEPLLDRFDRKTHHGDHRLNEWTRKWWRWSILEVSCATV